ncbi:hypothetical protein [Burkholderia cepacia]|uniref:hypothetical protein n=1 Tax=Burkholderia cepacia TaxID=292 RepID=UPI0012D8DE23|nr:hypothetical protein [Burkholderia cepacia]
MDTEPAVRWTSYDKKLNRGGGGSRLRGTWPVLLRPGGGETARSISRPLFSVFLVFAPGRVE